MIIFPPNSRSHISEYDLENKYKEAMEIIGRLERKVHTLELFKERLELALTPTNKRDPKEGLLFGPMVETTGGREVTFARYCCLTCGEVFEYKDYPQTPKCECGSFSVKFLGSKKEKEKVKGENDEDV